MKLERLVLILVIIAAAIYATALVVGVLAATPISIALAILALFAVFGYIIWRVIAERLANAEDDYYDKNVDR